MIIRTFVRTQFPASVEPRTSSAAQREADLLHQVEVFEKRTLVLAECELRTQLRDGLLLTSGHARTGLQDGTFVLGAASPILISRSFPQFWGFKPARRAWKICSPNRARLARRHAGASSFFRK
jgi:hypothetical protein